MTLDFRAFALSPALLEVVDELGYSMPTPVQAASLPHLLAGADLIGQSKTGSGKTAAFGLPILNQLDESRRSLQALVICPTRELATQVARELRKLGRKIPSLNVVVLAGGQPVRPQVEMLMRGAHIAVGTPGRLGDLLERQQLDVRGLRTVVLDEADRMLDMGFADAMDALLRAMPRARQTVLFSATYPDSIEAISRKYQRDPVRVTVDDPDELPSILQNLMRVEQADKRTALVATLAAHPHESAIVFCNTKVAVAEVESALVAAGMSVASLHGDLEQFDRDRVLAKFRNRSTRVLVATDVAARGLDIEDLDLVVNFDLPKEPEVYVHRIGRTGRAGRTGLAVSFATPREDTLIATIAKLRGVAFERVSAPRGASVAPSAPQAAAMVTLFMSGGRKEKVRPGDILGALTGEAGGFDAAQVGKIEIHDHFTYFAVAESIAESAVRSLSEGKIKGRRFRVGVVR